MILKPIQNIELQSQGTTAVSNEVVVNNEEGIFDIYTKTPGGAPFLQVSMDGASYRNVQNISASGSYLRVYAKNVRITLAGVEYYITKIS